MKVQYSFLKDYLSTDLSQVKLTDVFTKVGFECESDGPIIDFDITPNRGDVLSLRGLQREFQAQQSKAFKDKSHYKTLTFNGSRGASASTKARVAAALALSFSVSDSLIKAYSSIDLSRCVSAV